MGAIKNLKFGPIRIEGHRPISRNDAAAGDETPTDVATLSTVNYNSSQSTRPFEIRAIENYYNQALQRVNISFWFSLSFASIGFAIIVIGIFSYNSDDIFASVLKVLSGTIIDAVASLFFVQAASAQKAMILFIDKLRLDRLNAEARELLDGIENDERRDQLRAQMIIKYSSIETLIVGS